MPRQRASMDSNSSTSTSPERELDDEEDNESVMIHGDGSQSSLSVSLEEMEIDNVDYDRQRRESPISRLPAEILIAIFSKLSSPHDIQCCMRVCKIWARNAVDLLWHRPSTNHMDSLNKVINTATDRKGYFAYADLVKRLNLGQLKDEVSDETLRPLASCKRVERLTLPGCSLLTDAGLVPVIKGNRALMAIDVSDLTKITDLSISEVAKNCYRLQGLNLSNCRGVTDESLVEVAKSCRRLKRLKLNDCNQLTDLSIFAFADNCHDLLEIDLYKCTNITDQAVTALIKEGKQLRELRLAACMGITDEAFLHLPADSTYDALRILDLTDCHELKDDGLMKIVQAAPRLRNLVLAKCRNITDRGVMSITKLGKNLHFLHLGHCSNITDAGVIQLIKHCNRIRYIDFACCTRLTDDSVQQLANLPKLKRIGLVKCANITDLSIQALALRPKLISGAPPGYATNNLERLHLSYCSNLSIAGIRTLLLNCPHLTHLSLTAVQPFLREDIVRFCREAPQEFNGHQRDVFCVFSGTKVEELRQHLKEEYRTPRSASPGFNDDSPSTAFGGPSSVPTNNIWGVPDARHGFGMPHHRADRLIPPPPGLWTPQQATGPTPPPAMFQRFNPSFNPALPQAPTFPGLAQPPLVQSAPVHQAQFAFSTPHPGAADWPYVPTASRRGWQPFQSSGDVPVNTHQPVQDPYESNLIRNLMAERHAQAEAALAQQESQQNPLQQPTPRASPVRGPSEAVDRRETPMAFPPSMPDDEQGGVTLQQGQ